MSASITGEVFVGDFLQHYGKKGMKWGVRRQIRKDSFRELKDVKKKNSEAFKKAAENDPTFEREVRATLKRDGVRTDNYGFEVTRKGGLITNRATGDFFDSQGKPISQDFANAVLEEARTRQNRREKIAIGGRITAGILLGAGLVKLSSLNS